MVTVAFFHFFGVVEVMIIVFVVFAVIIILPAILNLCGARRWIWNIVRLPIVVTVV